MIWVVAEQATHQREASENRTEKIVGRSFLKCPAIGTQDIDIVDMLHSLLATRGIVLPDYLYKFVLGLPFIERRSSEVIFPAQAPRVDVNNPQCTIAGSLQVGRVIDGASSRAGSDKPSHGVIPPY